VSEEKILADAEFHGDSEYIWFAGSVTWQEKVLGEIRK
jgi:hypothetical protein